MRARISSLSDRPPSCTITMMIIKNYNQHHKSNDWSCSWGGAGRHPARLRRAAKAPRPLRADKKIKKLHM